MRSAGAAAALLAGAMAFAPPARAQDVGSDLRAGFEALQAWRYDRARKIASDLVERGAEDAASLAFLAAVKLHHGDYVGARDLFREAEAAGAPAFLLRDRPTAEAAAAATVDYVEAPSERFVLRHPPGRDAILVPFAESTLERALDALGPLLGYTPEARILVELYPSAQTLAAVSTLTADEIRNSGTIALCKWNRLMATSPRGVVFGYAWRDTLAHELAHLLIGGASKNEAPIWLHEGLAKYVETAWRGDVGDGLSLEQQERLRAAAKNDELIPFSRMHPSMAKLPTQEETSLAFAEVFTFVEYLVGEKGWPGVQRLLGRLADEQPLASALESVYGASFEVLEARWRRYLRERPLRTPPPSHVVKGSAPVVLKDRPEAPDDELSGLDEDARRFARAADLLYARGRVEGAKIELQKAFDRAPSAGVAAKLAQVALQAGDLDAAEAAAREASAMSPHRAGPSVTLAEILVRRGATEEARIPLRRAVDVNPFDPRIHQLTLVVEADGGDPARLEHARRALALMEAPVRGDGGRLGQGALVRIEGPPFSRVYLSRDGGPFVPTRTLTPTTPFPVAPGRYAVRLLPPTGPAVETEVQIEAAADPQTVQTVVAEATGS